MIDLHTHTSISDGTLSPTELVRAAQEKHLEAVAVTDHDIVDGLPEALAAGREIGLLVIPGVEISADSRAGSMHILGYFIDYRDASFRRALQQLRQYRNERNPKIVAKLNQLGMALSYEEVKAKAGRGAVGRPHFAQVLVEKGYVRSTQEAFDKYLKAGAPAYVDKKRLAPAEAIELIHRAGGLAVMAHPVRLKVRDEQDLAALIQEVVDCGLDGIEAYYSDHSRELTRWLLDMARRFDLLVFGGSDFHGDHKPHIDLGVGRGDLAVPVELLKPIERRLGRSLGDVDGR
ncbi:MAG: PHP domain-containing protein [Acidobacteria bacterium]|nr:MAG: PHP domain-containing protein [Acidobacteriota bacterium]